MLGIYFFWFCYVTRVSLIYIVINLDQRFHLSREKLINVSVNMNRDPFILSTLAGDEIYIAKRGEFQCMKASFNNGILTPVYIGLLNDESLFMIGILTPVYIGLLNEKGLTMWKMMMFLYCLEAPIYGKYLHPLRLMHDVCIEGIFNSKLWYLTCTS